MNMKKRNSTNKLMSSYANKREMWSNVWSMPLNHPLNGLQFCFLDTQLHRPVPIFLYWF